MSDSKKTDATPMEELLGAALLVKDGSKTVTRATKDVMRGKEFVLLYFSASWCPPCQAFSPVLAEFYKKHAAARKIEVVYVSSDRSLNEFQDYYGKKMPWAAIPTDADAAAYKNKLATRLQIAGIPSLVVLEAETGLFITNKAREQIQGKTPALELVKTWKETPAVTLEEGAAQSGGVGGGGIGGLLFKLVMAVLKNPIYIFGLLYFYKAALRKYNAYIAESATGEE